MVKTAFVIGGGPAGLAAAIAARRRGFRVTVADARIPPIDKACGEGLMPDGVAAAEELGLDLKTAEPMRGVRFLHGGKSVESAFPGEHAFGFRRTALHESLVATAERAGVELRWNTPVRTGPEADWIVNACGASSPARPQRFGFRQHFKAQRWTDFLEVHWAEGLQIYITPTAPDEVGIAVLTRDPKMRVTEALKQFPDVQAKLQEPASTERGSVTGPRGRTPVQSANTAFIGDASGTVDAITGEGLAMSFRQAFALADAMAKDDLTLYQRAHDRLRRRPRTMEQLLLTLDRSRLVRTSAFAIMQAQPWIFRKMLAFHVHS